MIDFVPFCTLWATYVLRNKIKDLNKLALRCIYSRKRGMENMGNHFEFQISFEVLQFLSVDMGQQMLVP